jgi:hypothetical protein
VIELTDEMIAAFDAVWSKRMVLSDYRTDVRDALAAVLAIVEREHGGVGPCSAVLPHFVDDTGIWCELRHGHTGDHESGPTRWKERA